MWLTADPAPLYDIEIPVLYGDASFGFSYPSGGTTLLKIKAGKTTGDKKTITGGWDIASRWMFATFGS
jgi:hypothetical protein